MNVLSSSIEVYYSFYFSFFYCMSDIILGLIGDITLAGFLFIGEEFSTFNPSGSP